MFIDRNGFNTENATNLAKLKETCLGCKDCKGGCLELLEMTQLPNIVLAMGDAQS